MANSRLKVDMPPRDDFHSSHRNTTLMRSGSDFCCCLSHMFDVNRESFSTFPYVMYNRVLARPVVKWIKFKFPSPLIWRHQQSKAHVRCLYLDKSCSIFGRTSAMVNTFFSRLYLNVQYFLPDRHSLICRRNRRTLKREIKEEERSRKDYHNTVLLACSYQQPRLIVLLIAMYSLFVI